MIRPLCAAFPPSLSSSRICHASTQRQTVTLHGALVGAGTRWRTGQQLQDMGRQEGQAPDLAAPPADALSPNNQQLHRPCACRLRSSDDKLMPHNTRLPIIS